MRRHGLQWPWDKHQARAASAAGARGRGHLARATPTARKAATFATRPPPIRAGGRLGAVWLPRCRRLHLLLALRGQRSDATGARCRLLAAGARRTCAGLCYQVCSAGSRATANTQAVYSPQHRCMHMQCCGPIRPCTYRLQQRWRVLLHHLPGAAMVVHWTLCSNRAQELPFCLHSQLIAVHTMCRHLWVPPASTAVLATAASSPSIITVSSPDFPMPTTNTCTACVHLNCPPTICHTLAPRLVTGKWLNNCIGAANYRSFFILVATTLTMLTVQLGWGLYLISRRQAIDSAAAQHDM